MPRVALTSRARQLRGALGQAISAKRPEAEIEALRIRFKAARAQGLIEAGKQELAEVEAIVARTRAEQGLPEHVEDPATLGRIADALRVGGGPDA